VLECTAPKDGERRRTANGRVAQWQSSGLLSHWLKVRVLPRSPDRTHPEPQSTSVKQLLALLRFDGRSKLAELPGELVTGWSG
jgi:hypothetical protein